MCEKPSFSLGFCHACVQTISYLDRYPVLELILTGESLQTLKHKISGVDRVCAKCQVCSKITELDLISLTKIISKHTRKGTYTSYRCFVCSKVGKSGVSVDRLPDVVDVQSTINKFGTLPKNAKTGSIVVRCEDCQKPSDIKLSSLLHQARRHKKAGRTCIYKCLSCGNKRPDVISRNLESRLRQLNPNSRSGLEVAVENRLKSMGISFSTQYPVGMYLWDFFLPEYGVLIDVDGEYWHSLPENIAKGKAKRTYASRYAPSLRQLTILEVNLLNPTNIDKLINEFTGIPSIIIQENFDFKDVVLRHIPLDKSGHMFFDSYHYARSGRPSKNIFIAKLGDDIIGVVKFNSVTRMESASALKLKTTEVFELDRFCIHPNYHKKNFASWLLSRCTNLFLKSKPSAKCLISFSDPSFGHTGTIYRASNWLEKGVTSPSYHYIDPAGNYINKKRVYDVASKLKLKEQAYASKHGLVRFREKPKSRFIYYRDRHSIIS